jgi:hypothetical protein
VDGGALGWHYHLNHCSESKNWDPPMKSHFFYTIISPVAPAIEFQLQAQQPPFYILSLPSDTALRRSFTPKRDLNVRRSSSAAAQIAHALISSNKLKPKINGVKLFPGLNCFH